MHTCPNCGGSIIGDGYTEVMHCEFVDESLYWDCEPDASVVYCEPEENISENIEKQKE